MNTTYKTQHRNRLLTATSASILLLLTAASGVMAQDVQSFQVPLTNPGQQASLEVDFVNGSIEVIGEDRDDLQFEASAREGRQKIITPSGSVPVSTGSFELEVSEQDNRVEVDSDSWNGAIDLTVRVPRNIDLELSTVNNGTITVRGTRGLHALENVNGEITATDISGTLLAETVNGDIDARMNTVNMENPMSLGSVNGALTLGLPDGFSGIVNVDSQSNEIFSDFEMTLLPTEPEIKRSEGKKSFKISLNRSIRARIGDGSGPEIRMETLHGKVSVLKTK